MEIKEFIPVVNSLILLIGILGVLIIFKEPISSLIFGIKSLRYKSKQSELELDTRGDATIQRSDTTSIVKSEELNKLPEINDEIISFETSDALQFYNTCAEDYDKANSDWLWETHERVAREIIENIPDKEASVLDLGGGTGRYIATTVMSAKSGSIIKWTNFDFSENMQNVFAGHMRTGALPNECVNMDIHSLKDWKVSGKYDIVVLSFVLSSMKKYPDFEVIRTLLKSGGLLIIAEGDPIYTTEKGNVWPVKRKGSLLKFGLNPVNPAHILSLAIQASFILIDTKMVKKSLNSSEDAVDYSYVLSFKAN